MGTKAILGLAVVLIAGVSFFAGLLLERHWLAAKHPTADGQSGQGSAQPTKEERRREAFLQYLDGKTIDLKNPKAAADKAGTQHTIRKEEVQSVQFPTTMSKITGDPWRPDVLLTLNTSAGRYFVRCTVPYHDVQDSFAFLGLEVIEVAKQ
jgi:hypothetical protein